MNILRNPELQSHCAKKGLKKWPYSICTARNHLQKLSHDVIHNHKHLLHVLQVDTHKEAHENVMRLALRQRCSDVASLKSSQLVMGLLHIWETQNDIEQHPGGPDEDPHPRTDRCFAHCTGVNAKLATRVSPRTSNSKGPKSTYIVKSSLPMP